MDKIIIQLVKSHNREKLFLYFSYVLNLALISVLVMISTGLSNITNESLSASDKQQVEAILLSVISVSVAVIVFFQWIISMQFRALYSSRKNFNDGVRLLGASVKSLFGVYFREMLLMQIVAVVLGIICGQLIFTTIARVIGMDVLFIGFFQIVLSCVIHLIVLSCMIMLTFRRLTRKSVIDSIRNSDDRTALKTTKFTKVMSIAAPVVILCIAVPIIANEKKDANLYLCEFILLLIAFRFILLDLHKLLKSMSKRFGLKSLLMAESISEGFFKRIRVVCILILISSSLYCGLQMLYQNVRTSAQKATEDNIHYDSLLWYDDIKTHDSEATAGYSYAYKFKTKHKDTVWYIHGVSPEFFGEWETIVTDDLSPDIKEPISDYYMNADWNGIIVPNTYAGSRDIGSVIQVDIDGHEIEFTVVGTYFNINFAHLNLYASKGYIEKQLKLQDQFNALYVKDESSLQGIDSSGCTIQSYEGMVNESRTQAVQGTSLVEMVAIVVIVASALALLNYIMISSKSDKLDISRLKGLGVSDAEIYRIYGIASINPVLIASIVAIPVAILFAKGVSYMMFDQYYFRNGFSIPYDSMVLCFVIFGVVSIAARFLFVRRALNAQSYINVLRDINSL